jgi:ABC-2 type transport system ATP-binding protein/lipopolysaccharide transport system ATP-binding protein
MPESTISIDSVSLSYRLAKQRIPSFKDYAIHWLKGALTYESFWALTDVSFEIARGESVGIVGRNGAGKSSLLKIIAGVLPPTKGKVRVAERIAPILELGTGFDFELTGRENIHLNALLLGWSRREIAEREEAIVEFAELGQFIDAPLRAYSTGMFARLGFAIATAWHPDILILDEVFAAGDAAFTLKCEERIREFRKAGVTILLVSHAAYLVTETCDRCLWLDKGKLRADGPSVDVVRQYYDETVTPAATAGEPPPAS